MSINNDKELWTWSSYVMGMYNKKGGDSQDHDRSDREIMLLFVSGKMRCRNLVRSTTNLNHLVFWIVEGVICLDSHNHYQAISKDANKEENHHQV